MNSPKKPHKAVNQEEKKQKHVVELIQTAPSSEFSSDFFDRMLFHMGGRSIDKYGSIEKRYPKQDQALPHIVDRFTKYLYTRNRKFLVDAANFAMIEFMCPSVNNAFFEGTDSAASPGRIFDGGEQSDKRNLDLAQPVTEKPSGIKIVIETDTPESEFSQKFFQGMVNRMGVSFAKYGAVKDGYPFNVNAPESLLLRIQKYTDSANTEFLMDVANFCMIEFMYPSLVKTHYNPIEDLSDAGRAAVSTIISQHPAE